LAQGLLLLMKMSHMFRLLSICTLLVFPVLLQAQSAKIDFASKGWANLLSEAKKSDKLIFLDAYTTWCGPCKLMDKKVFSDAKVASFFNEKFINAKIDMEKGEGPEIARTYRIAAYPTLLFINGDGKMVHRGVGFHDNAELLELAETAEQGTGTLSEQFEKFEAGEIKDPASLLNLTQKAFELQNNSHLPVAQAYLKKIRDLIYQEADPEMDPKDLYKLDGLFAKAYPKEAKKKTANFKMSFFRQRGDRENFALSALDYMKANKKAPAGELNDLAWTFFQVVENPTLLKSAVKWAKKASKKDRKSHHFDTLSALYEKVGNSKKALKAAKAGYDTSSKVKEYFLKYSGSSIECASFAIQ